VFRKELVELLRGKLLPLSEIARLEKTRVQDLADDLEHLRKSLRHEGLRLVVDPARCQKCDFEFTKGKLVRPGRCPKCRSTWIDEPRVGIQGG
jgi:predicted Zn-ribbon and HTH transcriptional regulator